MNTKYIAFFLPQYHRVPENDAWWGEGFTEWTNVKKAKPVFKGQIQPKVPLDNNYYDLTQKETVLWQTELMKRYGVDGLCYFHYWFNGKKLLHKPAENLLEWKDINQPFCFAWANCTWARTWSAVRATTWVSEDINNSGKEILLEQTYGTKEDWIKHYDYLRKFFLDERYIKKDGKPLFLIYQINEMACANEMIALWNELAIKDGLGGLHVVSMNYYEPNINVDAVVKYGNYSSYGTTYFDKVIYKVKSLLNLKNKNGYVYEYEKVWQGMVNEKYSTDIEMYPGAVVMYDETPRRGKDSTYLRNASPTLFEKYLRIQTQKRKSDFIFIDAWNEWGEGNYLEPDEENGYAYLEALSRVVKNQ